MSDMTHTHACHQLKPYKEIGVAYALLIFGGGFGLHRFYLNHVGQAVGFLALTTATLILRFSALITLNPETQTGLEVLSFMTGAALVFWWLMELGLLHASVSEANLLAGWVEPDVEAIRQKQAASMPIREEKPNRKPLEPNLY